MRGMKPKQQRLLDNPEVQQALNPQQMEQYRKALGMGMIALYSEKFMDQAEKLIAKSPTPASGIGDVAAMIGIRIYKEAMAKGDQLDPNILPLAGMDLVREVAEFAEKFADVEVTPEVIEQAFLVASDALRAGLGRAAPDMRQQAEQAIQQVGPEEAQAMAKMSTRARLPKEAQPRRGLGGGY